MSRIYGNGKQYDKFWIFIANKTPSYLDYFLLQQYADNEVKLLIADFPEEADNWLLQYCPFDWVIEQIENK